MFDDAHEVIERKDVNTILVLTPEYLHEEHAIASLQAGHAVFLEKPMAITTESCDRILRTTYELKGKLYLGHNLRHYGPFRAVKKVIDEGLIGDVQWISWPHTVPYGGDSYFRDWHAERKNVTGLLLHKGSHDIDIINWFGGAYPKRVSAMGRLAVYNRAGKRAINDDLIVERVWKKEHWPPLEQSELNPKMDVEDMSHMLIELENGVLAYYGHVHFAPHGIRGGVIVGDSGMIDWTNYDNFMLFTEREERGVPIEVPEEEGGHGGADSKIVKEFIGFVRGEVTPSTSPVSSRYAVAAAVEATNSLRTDQNTRFVPRLDSTIASYF